MKKQNRKAPEELPARILFCYRFIDDDGCTVTVDSIKATKEEACKDLDRYVQKRYNRRVTPFYVEEASKVDEIKAHNQKILKEVGLD